MVGISRAGSDAGEYVQSVRWNVAAVHRFDARLQAAFRVFQRQEQHRPGFAFQLAERMATGGDRESDDQREPGLAELRRPGDDSETLLDDSSYELD